MKTQLQTHTNCFFLFISVLFLLKYASFLFKQNADHKRTSYQLYCYDFIRNVFFSKYLIYQIQPYIRRAKNKCIRSILGRLKTITQSLISLSVVSVLPGTQYCAHWPQLCGHNNGTEPLLMLLVVPCVFSAMTNQSGCWNKSLLFLLFVF